MYMRHFALIIAGTISVETWICSGSNMAFVSDLGHHSLLCFFAQSEPKEICCQGGWLPPEKFLDNKLLHKFKADSNLD